MGLILTENAFIKEIMNYDRLYVRTIEKIVPDFRKYKSRKRYSLTANTSFFFNKQNLILFPPLPVSPGCSEILSKANPKHHFIKIKRLSD